MINKIMELYKEKTKKECYKIEIEENVDPSILDDKIGGIPYIPVGEEYPLDKNNNPMALLIQINFENIKLNNFPQKGILEIFVDKDLDWPCQYKIKYFKDIEKYREDLSTLDLKNNFIEKPLKIKLSKDIEHMPSSDYRFYDTMSEVINEITGIKLNNYIEINKFFEENGSDMYVELDKINIFAGNLGGYADFTQTDPRTIDDTEENSECLIKVDSNLGHGIMIGDCGIIFALISKKDLESQNFDKTVVDWDCC